MCDNSNNDLPSHVNYGKFALERILREKERVALINGTTGEQMTFGEMAQQIVNVAASLTRRGVQQGEVVGICSENRQEFMITAMAVFCTGATATFINRAYSQNDMLHTMAVSKPKYMFLSPMTYELCYETIKNTNMVQEYFIYGTTESKEKDQLIKFSDLTETHVDIDSYKPFDFDVTRTALIMYSSGTTGPSKGVKTSHSNLISSALEYPYYRGDLNVLTLAPWCNTVGIILTMPLLLRNQTIIFIAKYNEDLYLQCIQKYKVELLMTVPSLLVALTKSDNVKNYDVSSVKLMHCGGAPLEPLTITEVKKIFSGLKHILQGYGLTETTGTVTQVSETANKEGSVGKVVSGLTVKIIDSDTKTSLGPNKAGEICVKGPTIFEGYIGKYINNYLDEEGFFKTGDLAYYDDDGYYFIVDRLKEIIKYKAGQVSPSELEALLLAHEAVQDAGVVGAPDILAGELPTAFVVKKPGFEVTEQEIIDFVASKVSSWKQLRGGVKFVNEIPKTSSGKVLRRILRNWLSRV